MKIKKLFNYTDLAIFLLLCVVLITIYHVNNANSRYKSTATGSTNTTVAKWNVTAEPVTQDNTIDLIAGNTSQSYIISVSSNSEVSNNYSIVVSNIPNDVLVSLDGGTAKTPANRTVTFSDVGTFNVGEGNTPNQHTLTFNAPIECAVVTNNDVNIQVVFTQKD